MEPSLHRVYRYRLYPKPMQEERLLRWLELCRRTYNKALWWRQGAWERDRTRVERREQIRALTELKRHEPEYRDMPPSVTEDVVKRVDLAYQAFFRRCKEPGEAPGYPKAKQPGNYYSFRVMRSREFLMEHDGAAADRYGFLNIKSFGLGSPGGDPLAVRMHRPLPAIPGIAVRRVEIKREAAGRWFACFGWDAPVDTVELAPEKVVALHPGLVHYLTTDTGETFEAPFAWLAYADKLAAAQWRMSKKKGGSYRYLQEKQAVGRWHAKIKAYRRDYQHNLSRRLVNRYDRIIINSHDIRRMISGDELRHLNLRVADAAWGEFCFMLQYKCEAAGKDYVEVSSEDTVDPCSRCDTLVRKSLKDREHVCSNCGLKLSRGANAARNARKKVEAGDQR